MNYGLTGFPLGHSMSKVIHKKLFELKNQDYAYELYQTDELDTFFDETLKNLDGFNVTIPYKTEIIKYMDFVDEKVSLYNACNTVVKHNGSFYGYNTDVYGFLSAVKRKGIDLKNKKVLILGSGGVSRMFAFECVISGACVSVLARNEEKSKLLKEEVEEKTGKTICISTSLSHSNNYDILINGTPCGMYPNVLSMPVSFEFVKNVPFFFDAVYNPKKTLMTKMFEYIGASAEDGLYMLVAQAAEAQKHFLGNDFSCDETERIAKSIDIDPLKLDKNIVLIGSPGCGKSRVGKELAEILNLKFVDIDKEIENEYGCIENIFANYGEEKFRNIEKEITDRYISQKNYLVSTGGGVVKTSEIMEKIKGSDKNIVLFINPSFDVLKERVGLSADRPLLKDNPSEKLKKLLDERIGLYEKYADFTYGFNKEQSVKSTVIGCVDALCGF